MHSLHSPKSLIEIRMYADRLFVIVGIRFIVFIILREMYISVERLLCTCNIY